MVTKQRIVRSTVAAIIISSLIGTPLLSIEPSSVNLEYNKNTNNIGAIRLISSPLLESKLSHAGIKYSKLGKQIIIRKNIFIPKEQELNGTSVCHGAIVKQQYNFQIQEL